VPGPSAIEWTQATWNPVTGCTKVSPGCAHCYAETFAERWRGIPGHPYEQGFDLKLWPSRLEHPLRWKKPRVIFVNSMSDLFHEEIPAEYVAKVFDVMTRADQHIYQVLTKRHERMAELASDLPWPPHIWMGVSIENRRFVERADYLRRVPAAIRFISAEPLLGYLEGLDLTDIDWVITGGESGPKHRPVKAEWIRDVRDRCEQAGAAFFFKQWGGSRAKSGGRKLDGREYNDMPPHDVNLALTPTGPPRQRRNRQRDVPDDADEKWHYSAHTAAKHEILRRYLGAWLAILGRGQKGRGFRHKQLVLVDGFAGRGRYMGGEPGSPRIMFDRAVQVVEDGLAEKVLIRCAEPNAGNFEHLVEVCAGLKHDRVTIRPTQQTFEEIGKGIVAWARGLRTPPPTFVMIDPYGVAGVPFSLLRQLMSFDRFEVLLTFMVRDPARFLRGGSYDDALTALFGGNAWKVCRNDDEDRPRCLMLRFREVAVPKIAKYALAFRVFEDERRIPLYYLVHLTNSDVGMREMKKAMVKEHGEMTFWPITLRDPRQIELDVAESKPYPSLQNHLGQTYGGKSMSFVELLNSDYPDGGAWLEPQYREAVKYMSKQDSPLAAIDYGTRLTPTGRTPTGLDYPDQITFASPSEPA
jgi:three-Cys-motif partner protein